MFPSTLLFAQSQLVNFFSSDELARLINCGLQKYTLRGSEYSLFYGVFTRRTSFRGFISGICQLSESEFSH
jgi:hypothetical protein